MNETDTKTKTEIETECLEARRDCNNTVNLHSIATVLQLHGT